MTPKQTFKKVQRKYLKEIISEGHLSIIFVAVICVVIGFLSLLIEHSKGAISWMPLALFFAPAIGYYIISTHTKNFELSSWHYLLVGFLYLFLCYIEFENGYSLDEFMKHYWRNDSHHHAMAFILKFVPTLYKIVKIGLSIAFFRLAYLQFQYERLA